MVASFVPPEIICHVLCFLTPCDILRLRAVSKQFRDITYTPSLWRTLYANARLPRPPGPFYSQSVHLLERTLVKSERLAQSWTAQPMEYTSSSEVPLRRSPTSLRIINNQWLVGCETLTRRFVVYDLDVKAGADSQKILWEHNELIIDWDVCPVTSAEGLVLCIVFSDAAYEGPLAQRPWHLLEFRMNSGTGDLYHSHPLTVPTKYFNQPVILDGGRGPFLYIGIQQVIFHVEEQRFYEFPPFYSVLDNFPRGSKALTLAENLFTKTHVITLLRFFHDTEPGHLSTLVQAFTLPNGTESNVLRLSHEGIMDDFPQVVDIIRNSLVDPVNGMTSIRLLDQSFGEGNVCLSCIDLMLPRPTPTNLDSNTVLPMSIRAHNIIRTSNILHGSQNDWARHIEASDDGFVRGLWRFRMNAIDALMYGVHATDSPIMRFTIDASEEKCTAVLGKVLPANWHADLTFDGILHYSHAWMDGTRGRMCYEKNEYGESVAVVMNFD
ncbi:hypothetical protein JVU11DRAFT_8670 [Chiua virens]|nr:hypothetical protein JVU11DRAFT_8670 [Chiua virens]